MSQFLQEKGCILHVGHLAYCENPALIGTVCGNGLIVTLRNRIRHIGAIAHCIDPQAEKGARPSYYQADIAVLSMLQVMKRAGTLHMSNLEAQLFGAGHYNGHGKKRAQKAVKIVQKILKKQGVNIISEDIGGTLGRKIVFNSFTGESMVFKTNNVRKMDWFPEWQKNNHSSRTAFKRKSTNGFNFKND